MENKLDVKQYHSFNTTHPCGELNRDFVMDGKNKPVNYFLYSIKYVALIIMPVLFAVFITVVMNIILFGYQTPDRMERKLVNDLNYIKRNCASDHPRIASTSQGWTNEERDFVRMTKTVCTGDIFIGDGRDIISNQIKDLIERSEPIRDRNSGIRARVNDVVEISERIKLNRSQENTQSIK